MKDLFNIPEQLPLEVQAVLSSYSKEDNTYQYCGAMLKELESLGYTFDYDLHGEVSNLRPISGDVSDDMSLEDKLTELINEMDSSDLVALNNAYCQSANYSDDEIYDNDEEFFNMFFEGKVIEAVRAVSFGEYNYSDDYVKFNGYGNLESMNYLEPKDLVESVSTIVERIIENPEDFDMFDLDDIKEELENS